MYRKKYLKLISILTIPHSNSVSNVTGEYCIGFLEHMGLQINIYLVLSKYSDELSFPLIQCYSFFREKYVYILLNFYVIVVTCWMQVLVYYSTIYSQKLSGIYKCYWKIKKTLKYGFTKFRITLNTREILWQTKKF